MRGIHFLRDDIRALGRLSSGSHAMPNRASRPLIFSHWFLYFVLPARIAMKGNWRMPVASRNECLGNTASGQSQGREAERHRIR